MSTAIDTIPQLNRDLARKINAAARNDPQSPYANKLVGIANGQVVVVTEYWDELANRLRHAEPNPSNTFALEASRDYDEVHDIWEVE